MEIAGDGCPAWCLTLFMTRYDMILWFDKFNRSFVHKNASCRWVWREMEDLPAMYSHWDKGIVFSKPVCFGGTLVLDSRKAGTLQHRCPAISRCSARSVWLATHGQPHHRLDRRAYHGAVVLDDCCLGFVPNSPEPWVPQPYQPSISAEILEFPGAAYGFPKRRSLIRGLLPMLLADSTPWLGCRFRGTVCWRCLEMCWLGVPLISSIHI